MLSSRRQERTDIRAPADHPTTDPEARRTSPGRVNAHTHLYSALAPLGMPAPAVPPTSFPEILERVWWRLDRALDETTLRAAARLYAAETLLAGTTAVIDHHESPELIEGSLDVLADACEELGLRAVLCYGATERNGGRDEARRGLAECARFLTTNERRLVRGVVGLHAPFTCSDETLREAGQLARELETVVHVHVAEDACDVDDARARGHEGPLQRLLALDALPEGSILAHGVHLSTGEVALARERGLWLVHNPRSNVANGVGYAMSLSASDRVALGTDGFPADMTDELEVALREAHAAGDDARAVGRRLDAGQELFAGLNPATAEVTPGCIRVEGREVARGGRLLAADLEGVRSEAESAAQALWRRLEALA